MRVQTERLQGSDSPATRAVRLLLHKPDLASEVEDVELLRSGDAAEVELLAQLIELLHERPNLKTGALLEHYRSHEWFPRLNELVRSAPEISDPASLRAEFVGCLRLVRKRAEHHRAQRRIEELAKRRPSELSDDERREFTELTRLVAGGTQGRGDGSRRDD